MVDGPTIKYYIYNKLYQLVYFFKCLRLTVSISRSSKLPNLSKDDKQPLLTGQFLKMEVLLGATGLENRRAGRIRLLNGFFLRIYDLLRCSVCLSVCCGSRDSWLLPGEILIRNNMSCQGDRPNIIIAALAEAVRRAR